MIIELKKENNLEVKVLFNINSLKNKDKMKLIPNVKWRSGYWYIPYSKSSIEKLLNVFKNAEIIPDESINYFLETENICINKELISSIKNLLNEIEQQLKLKGYSIKTRKSYLGHIYRLSIYYKKHPKEISNEELQKYLLDLLYNRNKSHSYVNQAISSIKFFYNVILKQIININLPRPKKEHKLPDVLSQKEVLELLKSIENDKVRLIQMEFYFSS